VQVESIFDPGPKLRIEVPIGSCFNIRTVPPPDLISVVAICLPNLSKVLLNPPHPLVSNPKISFPT